MHAQACTHTHECTHIGMHKYEHAYVFAHMILGSSTQGLMHGKKAHYSYTLSSRPYLFPLPHLHGSLKPLSQSDNFS